MRSNGAAVDTDGLGRVQRIRISRAAGRKKEKTPQKTWTAAGGATRTALRITVVVRCSQLIAMA